MLNSIGLQSTATGMSNSPFMIGGSDAFLVGRATDIPDQLKYAASLPTNTSKIGAIAAAIRDLSALHPDLTNMGSDGLGAVKSAFQKNMSYVNATIPAGVDPADHTGPGDTFESFVNFPADLSTNRANRQGDSFYRFAMGLSYMLRGDIDFCGFTLGGRDYHGNDQFGAGGTRAKDFEVGQLISSICRAALRTQSRSIVIVLTKDGSVNGVGDHQDPKLWLGDRGIIGAYSAFYVGAKSGEAPSGFLSNGMRQIGARRADNGITDTSTMSGKNDLTGSSAIAANILHLAKLTNDQIARILKYPDAAAVNQLLAFKKS